MNSTNSGGLFMQNTLALQYVLTTKPVEVRLRLELTLGRTVRDLNQLVGEEISYRCLQ